MEWLCKKAMPSRIWAKSSRRMGEGAEEVMRLWKLEVERGR
jgi:hypothetical protein